MDRKTPGKRLEQLPERMVREARDRDIALFLVTAVIYGAGVYLSRYEPFR